MAQSFWKRFRGILLVLVLLLLVAAVVLPSPSTSLGAYVYELVRRCPEAERPVAAAPFLVIGHRGAAGHAIENTLPSMDAALAHGANAIEIDLCMTRDSAVVLWHDWMPDDPIAQARQTGAETDVLYKPLIPEDEEDRFRRPTHELTLAEIREHWGYSLKDSNRRVAAHIPTLEEFLAWSRGKDSLRAVYLDIKVPEEQVALAPAFIARIERLLAAAGPSYEVVYLVAQEKVYAAVEPMLVRGNISFDREPDPGLILDPCEQGSTPAALERANRHASLIMPVTSTFAPWTTVRRIAECDIERGRGRVTFVMGTENEPDKLACLVGIGVNGVFTDFPERLRAIVGHR